MQPGAFLCSGCGRRVEETYHGSGFEKCGSLRHDEEDMLCPRCLSILKEVLDALRAGREALAAYLREVEASPWP